MARQSKAQKDTVQRVMHEYKHGELRIRGKGPKVKSREQAVAIALHEAGASRDQSPKDARTTLRKTKAKERAGRTARDVTESMTKAELYEKAKRRNVAGRSTMTKAELARAVG